ncbi:hypothetical protein OAG36_00725 [bacterium]|nr:hypothetical protein [bacterium]
MMHLVVCTAQGIADTDYSIPAWTYAREQGHRVDFYKTDEVPEGVKPDALIGLSITQMDPVNRMCNKFPDVPLFSYCWDAYEWCFLEHRHKGYDYRAYVKQLQKSEEVWVPSYCTGIRLKDWFGMDSYRVRSAIPYWEYDNVRDDGYVLCTLREIPDTKWGWFKQSCEELNIPHMMTEHTKSFSDYQDAVAGCRLLVSHCDELSTGGLTLLEGYYLGKPSLLSDSPWHGGTDYLGDRATYFDHTDFEDFKLKLSEMYKSPPPVATDNQYYVVNGFKDYHIVKGMLERVQVYLDGV